MKDFVEKAFDYRGDVTVDLEGGETVEGFLFNRTYEAKTDFPDGFIEVIRPDDGETVRIGLEKITDIRLTGKDFAAT